MYLFGKHQFKDDDPIIELIAAERKANMQECWIEILVNDLVDYRNADAPYGPGWDGLKRWAMERIYKDELKRRLLEILIQLSKHKEDLN